MPITNFYLATKDNVARVLQTIAPNAFAQDTDPLAVVLKALALVGPPGAHQMNIHQIAKAGGFPLASMILRTISTAHRANKLTSPPREPYYHCALPTWDLSTWNNEPPQPPRAEIDPDPIVKIDYLH